MELVRISHCDASDCREILSRIALEIFFHPFRHDVPNAMSKQGAQLVGEVPFLSSEMTQIRARICGHWWGATSIASEPLPSMSGPISQPTKPTRREWQAEPFP